MRRLSFFGAGALVLGAASFAACQTDESTVPGSCEPGAWRCTGTVAERCTDGVFAASVDCADTAQSCALDAGGTAVCVSCTDGATRCTDGTLELCSGASFQSSAVCADTGQVCRTTGAGAACVALAWTQLPITIEDPVVNGSSLMVPIDAISFAYEPASDVFVTAFDRDLTVLADTFFWRLDGASGVHDKQPLSGTTFAASEGFCVGGEDWCQLLGFDPLSSEWVVLGPSTSGMMRVGSSFASSIVAVTGTHPPDSHVSRTHRFAWPARKLFLYGSTGPSSFGDAVYALDLDAASWSVATSGLPQVDDNCLAHDPSTGLLYSVGGRVTTDGGNTTQTLATYAVIDLAAGGQSTAPLPVEVGARQAMSCAFDPGRRVLYAFGGSVVNDPWDEAQNEYHNDLWALDVDQGTWTRLVADSASGTLGPPDAYGDHPFTGYPEGPNFGQNRGYLEYDAAHDRLVVIGAVPIFTHEQIYFLDLGGVEQLL
ncbi:MAG: hypothetical protein HY908_00410 [Myxococcales bacterium]|nr:hypothetical protein [Myxococcales bacterium]